MSKTAREQSQALHDLRNYAVFSQPKYLSDTQQPGDRKRPQSAYPSTHAKQVLTSPTKHGTTPDVYFQREYKPLCVGDEYIEMDKIETRRRMEQSKKNISTRPFVPSSPPKKSATPGDRYGQIGTPPEYKPEIDPSTSVLPRRPMSARNIITNPAKKGGPGYSHLTIGEEFKYISEAEVPPKKPPVGTIQPTYKAPKPFVPMIHRQSLFDDKVYSEPQIDPETLRQREIKAREFQLSGRSPNAGFYTSKKYVSPSTNRKRPSSAGGYVAHPRPWSGSCHTRGTFSKFPEYIMDSGPKKTTPKKPIQPFIPSGTSSYTKPTPSIIGAHRYTGFS
ncbi:putative protein of unknown function (DUF4586) [Monocercomonoides exilis]|uniref:putative protein of unknown function (DUF4586) n=1 Tax=Monocercomonoides exilis TaxID=2049356 RepID=UPI0035594777|nr:putative protein of unknown function (DUF4586) [Monocercomonoides exilis]|eukprot:MONOS_1816.1-p1 / transcript=MONOS_1816.1 / gene=MONOS_1816 / organism=Monocercomonoides_exilis_PA203 / gene_product=unspecified product / transcript_product=unspecified product / location=Mono_scaffold00034:88776-90148(-) / protein_length=332 / sequence_SO=supercontig / SO=protein_coding / is_pseudo=false